MSNLTQRILTGLVGSVVVVVALWMGGVVFALAFTAVGLLAQVEIYRLLQKAGTRPLVGLGLAIGAVAVLRPVELMAPVAGPLLVLGGLAVLVAVLFLRTETPLLDAAATLFGAAYPAALCGALVALRVDDRAWLAGTNHGAFWLTTAVLFCVWGTDTFAYFTGRAIGTHPLFPRVSPKKTWEGAVGGVVGAVLLASSFKAFTPLSSVLTWADVAAIAFACGVASPFGDLAESHFKRSVDVKDSASWLPGHGGMLDRIDAAVVAVPLVVIYLHFAKG